MFDYRKKDRRMISGNKKREEAILEEDRFSFPEDRDVHLSEKINDPSNHIDYVKKHFAARSKMSIMISSIGMAFFLVALWMMVRAMGQPSLTVSGIIGCSLLCSLIGFWYGGIAFLEKDKNYLLSYIGMAESGLQIVLIVLAMIAGGQA